jgi:hypothetical protein
MVANMKPASAPASNQSYNNQHAAWAGQLGFNGFAANPWPAYSPQRGSGRTYATPPGFVHTGARPLTGMYYYR